MALVIGIVFIGLGSALVASSKKISKKERMSFAFTEETRGNKMYQKYPPCYDICGATRTIQDKLEMELKSNVKEYKQLLDLYSIVLCQEVFINSPKREQMLSERIGNLEKMGAVLKSEYKHKASTEKMTRFLSLVKYMIEHKFFVLKNDKRISAKSKTDILKLNDVFYQIHFGKLELY
jgi:hypothetical protein